MAPRVILAATHEATLDLVALSDLKRYAMDLSSELGMPSRLTRFCSTCSRIVPSTTPRIEPSPPRSEQPPSTAAAMA